MLWVGKGKYYVLILLSMLLAYYVRCIVYLSKPQTSTFLSEDLITPVLNFISYTASEQKLEQLQLTRTQEEQTVDLPKLQYFKSSQCE